MRINYSVLLLITGLILVIANEYMAMIGQYCSQRLYVLGLWAFGFSLVGNIVNWSIEQKAQR